MMLTRSVSAQFQYNYYEQAVFQLQNDNYKKAVDLFTYSIQRNDNNPDAWFYRGFCKYELSDYHGAVADFSQAINLAPYYHKAWLYRAIVNNRLMNYEQALRDFDMAIELDQDDPLVYFQRAISMLFLKRYDEAISDCNTALDLGLNNVAVYTVRGIAYRGKKEIQRAVNDFNSVLSVQPDNTNVLVQKAISWDEAGRQDSAFHFINKAISLEHDFYFAYFQRAQMYIEDTAWNKALSDLNFILEDKPLNTSSLFYRALVYSQINKIEKAISDYSTILKKHPDNILAWYNRAGLYAEKDNYEAALEDYSECIRLFPDFADAYRNRAYVKEKLNRYREAAMDRKMAQSVNNINGLKSKQLKYRQGLKLQRLTSLDTDFSGSDTESGLNNIQAENIFFILPPGINGLDYKYYDVYNKAGHAYDQLTQKTIPLSNDYKLLKDNEIQSLVDSLDTEISEHPDQIMNYLFRASLLSIQENFNQAMDDFDRIRSIAPDFPLLDFSKANTYILLGLFMENIKAGGQAYVQRQKPQIQNQQNINPNFTDALSAYERCIKSDAEMSYAWFNKAYARSLTANHWKGIADFSTAIELNPQFQEAYFNKGLTYLYLKEKSKACETLGLAGQYGSQQAWDVISLFCR
jgi:tetratricopeptide (TPR) repeat protein